MFVSFTENKYQVIVSTILGSLYFYYTRDELASFIFTIVTIIFLRAIKLDKSIRNFNNNYRKF